MQVFIVPVTAYAQNCSILRCDKTGKGAVVDPGGDLDVLIETIEKEHIEVEKILLTHGHFDHCGQAAILAKKLNVPIEGPHRDDDFLLKSLDQWCAQVGFPSCTNFTPQRWLAEGDTVSFGEENMQVVHCPGHTPGHVIFHHQEEKLAFVGDVLFQGSIGRTDFPRGNHKDLINSISQKLIPLGDDITFVPGHGPNSTFGQERQNNPFIPR